MRAALLPLLLAGSVSARTWQVTVEHRGFNENGLVYLAALPLNACQALQMQDGGRCRVGDPKDTVETYPLLRLSALPKDGKFNISAALIETRDSVSFLDIALVDKARMDDYGRMVVESVLARRKLGEEERRTLERKRSLSLDFTPRASMAFGYFHGFEGKWTSVNYRIRETRGYDDYSIPSNEKPILDTTVQDIRIPSTNLKVLLEVAYPAYTVRFGINGIVPTAVNWSLGAAFRKPFAGRHEVYAGTDFGYTVISPGEYEDDFRNETSELPHSKEGNGYTVTPFVGLGLFQDGLASVFLEAGGLANLAVDNFSYGTYLALGARLTFHR